MKSRRFFRQKTSGGKAIHRQARTAKEKQAFSTLQDQILCRKNADYIHGNRIMFGSISVILLCVGLVNYFNIMFTGIVGRKKRAGDYEKDWNDTPAGKKAVIAGRQLIMYCLSQAL